MRFPVPVIATLLLAACSGVPLAPEPERVTGVDVVLIGEQHDAAGHARAHERWVSALAQQGQLAALALE
ncbi:MAG: hypothetical protein K0R89_3474, partial [Ramlibacter sp.]|nr:hypothetical protein [Ramlibacter sp.]